MSVQRATTSASYIDVLDRVLDKGILIDAWMRVSLGGIDLISIEARMVVASFDTYLAHADALARAGLLSRSAIPSNRFVSDRPRASKTTRR